MHPTRNSAAFIINLAGGRVMPGVGQLPLDLDMSKRFILVALTILAFSPSHAHSQGRGRSHVMKFEGTLLKYSPHPRIACGVLFIHQVAKYRVVRVLSGKYVGNEIVVDHPACGGDVFKSVPIGSHVKFTVRVWRNYLVTTGHPGIREKETPKVWYVAESTPRSASVPPTKIQ